MSVGVLCALIATAVVGGVGITALGPGGVLPTAALFALTGLTAAEVAGTSIVTHVATGVVGTLVFVRSGQLSSSATRRTATVLAAAATVGTPVGVLVTTVVSQEAFGYVLAAVVAAAGIALWWRSRRADGASLRRRHPPAVAVAVLGAGIAVLSGIVGLGGPMLAVPLLILVGVPMLEALAAAQVQSIVIAVVGTVGYGVHGSIDWALAVAIGVPEVVGVVLGWRLARSLPTGALTTMLIVVLMALAPYLAFVAGR